MAADHIRLRAATLHLFTQYPGVPGSLDALCTVDCGFNCADLAMHLAMPDDQLGWRSC